MRFLFILSEFSIYLLFLVMDIFYNQLRLANDLKFLGIISCLLFSIYQLINDAINKKLPSLTKDRAVVVTALFFTFLADVQLLYDGDYFVGICCFIFVQLVYLYRICHKYALPIKAYLKIRLLIVITALVIILQVSYLDNVIAASCVYIIIFIGNAFILLRQKYYKRQNNKKSVIKAQKRKLLLHDCVISLYRRNITAANRDKYESMFTLGMILFLLCDINVGIYNINSYINIGSISISRIIEFSSVLMWFFYLPSQVLIVLSADGYVDYRQKTL